MVAADAAMAQGAGWRSRRPVGRPPFDCRIRQPPATTVRGSCDWVVRSKGVGRPAGDGDAVAKQDVPQEGRILVVEAAALQLDILD